MVTCHDPTLHSVEDAIAAIGRGECVVVMDGEDRENEGDLVMAAARATPEAVGFIVRHTSGVVCVSLTAERADQLELPLMVTDSEDPLGTAFTVTVDARIGTTTGISAADRAVTIRTLADEAALATDFVRPGHVFPLRARPGGVLERPGHTEASCDLARLAGLDAVGVLAEIVSDDGEMARRPELRRFAAAHGLVCITIEQLVAYRRAHRDGVTRVSCAELQTHVGSARLHVYADAHDGVEHAVLVYGDPGAGGPILVRVHSECLTGDVLGSERCDCGAQLRTAQEQIAREGRGIIVYLRGHEGRGIGLGAKVAAYRLQERGLDTVDANLALGLPVDARRYDVAGEILCDLGIDAIRLLTNNPQKCEALEQQGIRVERVPLCMPPTRHNMRYLATKHDRLGHLAQPRSASSTLKAVSL